MIQEQFFNKFLNFADEFSDGAKQPVLSQSVYQALSSITPALTSGVFQIINVRQDSTAISLGNASTD